MLQGSNLTLQAGQYKVKEDGAFGTLVPISSERLLGLKAKLSRKYLMDPKYPKDYFSKYWDFSQSKGYNIPRILEF